jgi:hypothetical protein
MRDDLNVSWASGNQQQQQQSTMRQRDGTKRSGAGCCMHFTIRHDSERAYFGHIRPQRVEKILVSFTLA